MINLHLNHEFISEMDEIKAKAQWRIDMFDEFSGMMHIAYFALATGMCTLEEAVSMSHCSTPVFFDKQKTLITLTKEMLRIYREQIALYKSCPPDDNELLVWHEFVTDGAVEDYQI